MPNVQDGQNERGGRGIAGRVTGGAHKGFGLRASPSVTGTRKAELETIMKGQADLLHTPVPPVVPE